MFGSKQQSLPHPSTFKLNHYFRSKARASVGSDCRATHLASLKKTSYLWITISADGTLCFLKCPTAPFTWGLYKGFFLPRLLITFHLPFPPHRSPTVQHLYAASQAAPWARPSISPSPATTLGPASSTKPGCPRTNKPWSSPTRKKRLWGKQTSQSFQMIPQLPGGPAGFTQMKSSHDKKRRVMGMSQTQVGMNPESPVPTTSTDIWTATRYSAKNLFLKWGEQC